MKTIIKNLSLLSLVNIGNYIFPIAAFSMLTRNMSVESYGKYTFIIGFVGYFTVFTEWGYPIYFLNSIAKIPTKHKAFINKCNLIISVKFFLTCISAIILVAFLCYTNQTKDLINYLFSFIAVAATTISPIFLYIALNKNYEYALINITIKFIYIFLLFCFLKVSNNLSLLIFLNTFSMFLISAYALIKIYYQNNLLFRFSNVKNIFNELFETKYQFITSLSISFYTSIAVIIVGVTLTKIDVAFFSSAYLILKAIQSFQVPFVNIMIPLLHSRKYKYISINLLKFVQMFLGFLISLFVLFFSAEIISFVFGDKFQPSFRVLQLLAPIIFLGSVSVEIITQELIPRGLEKPQFYILFFAGLLNLLLGFYLTYNHGITGMAKALLITEFFICLLLVLYYLCFLPKKID